MEDVGKNLSKILDKRNYRDRFSRNDGDVLKDPDVKEFISEHREELTDADIQKVMRNSMNLFKKNESFV